VVVIEEEQKAGMGEGRVKRVQAAREEGWIVGGVY